MTVEHKGHQLYAGTVAAIHQAMAWDGKGDHARAMCCLERALDRCEPGGHMVGIVKSGGPMARLLRQAVQQEIHPQFARKLLKAINAEAGNYIPLGAPIGFMTAQTRSLPEPLTDRERQVLRFLATGLSSTEIAVRLILSVHTVRYYMKTIYRKLDVHSREQAISEGEEIGLL